MKMLRQLGAISIILAFSFFMAILGAEIAFRYQLIDFYAPEWNYYNSDTVEAPVSRRILVFGDSFTAGNAGYVKKIRGSDPHALVANSGVSDTTSRQMIFMADRRLSDVKPDLVIYQVFVGNDLYDIRYPDCRHISLARCLYWTVSDKLRVFAWLNYRLGQELPQLQLRFTGAPAQAHEIVSYDDDLMLRQTFDPATYTKRERIMAAAEPEIIADSIYLWGRRGEDFETLLADIRALQKKCEDLGCKLLVVVIPHKVQVSRRYLDQYRRLGYVVPDAAVGGGNEYPFVTELRRGLPDSVAVLSPLDRFRREEASGKRTYYANDGHLAPHGYDALYREILPLLSENLLSHYVSHVAEPVRP